MKNKLFFLLFIIGISLINCIEINALVSCTYVNKKNTEEKINTVIYESEPEYTQDGGMVTVPGYDEIPYGNNQTLMATVSIGFSVENFFYTKYDDFNDASAYYENEGSCPPYFYIVMDGSGNSWNAYYSDKEENNLNDEGLAEPDQMYEISSDSNVTKDEDGNFVNIAEKYSCVLFGKLPSDSNTFNTIVTINVTDKKLYFSNGTFYDTDYEKNFDYNFDTKPCPDDLYVCWNPLFTNPIKYVVGKGSTPEYAGQQCALLQKRDTVVKIGTNACNTYILSLESYRESINSKMFSEANKIKDKITVFCRNQFQYSNYSSYEYSCMNLCLNASNDFTYEGNSNDRVCGISQKLALYISNIVKWGKYLIPVLVIVLGILDFIKAISADKDDEMKKAQGRFVKRLIAAALIFIIPFIIEFVLDKMGFGEYVSGCGIDSVGL